jgi:hypothetical protein
MVKKQINEFLKTLYPFMKEQLGFDDDISGVIYEEDEQNAREPFGKTAYYDPNAKSITVYTTGRHPTDCTRSIAHEIVHHSQNSRGEFEKLGEGDTGPGYAQNNDHLRKMEKEAYERGNILFRDWQDKMRASNYKGNEENPMSQDKKIREIIRKKLAEAIQIKQSGRSLEEMDYGGNEGPPDSEDDSYMRELEKEFPWLKDSPEGIEEPLGDESPMGDRWEDEEVYEEGCGKKRRMHEADEEQIDEKTKKDIADRKPPDTPADRLKPLEEGSDTEEQIDEADEPEEIEESDNKEPLHEAFQKRHQALNERLTKSGWFKRRI